MNVIFFFYFLFVSVFFLTLFSNSFGLNNNYTTIISDSNYELQTIKTNLQENNTPNLNNTINSGEKLYENFSNHNVLLENMEECHFKRKVIASQKSIIMELSKINETLKCDINPNITLNNFNLSIGLISDMNNNETTNNNSIFQINNFPSFSEFTENSLNHYLSILECNNNKNNSFNSSQISNIFFQQNIDHLNKNPLNHLELTLATVPLFSYDRRKLNFYKNQFKNGKKINLKCNENQKLSIIINSYVTLLNITEIEKHLTYIYLLTFIDFNTKSIRYREYKSSSYNCYFHNRVNCDKILYEHPTLSEFPNYLTTVKKKIIEWGNNTETRTKEISEYKKYFIKKIKNFDLDKDKVEKLTILLNDYWSDIEVTQSNNITTLPIKNILETHFLSKCSNDWIEKNRLKLAFDCRSEQIIQILKRDIKGLFEIETDLVEIFIEHANEKNKYTNETIDSIFKIGCILQILNEDPYETLYYYNILKELNLSFVNDFCDEESVNSLPISNTYDKLSLRMNEHPLLMGFINRLGLYY